MVAVSGGVDSVVLLDLLVKQYVSSVKGSKKQITEYRLQNTDIDVRLIIAHYDHGIRKDSHKDREFVQKIAEKYGLPFVFDEGKLGADASEDTARKARYNFLEKVKISSGADAIITAHHQDDQIETTIFNLLRGTGRRGLTSLADSKDIARPLLGVPKKAIIDYAKKHSIKWREDPTNTDLKYRRNYIRKKIIPKMSTKQRKNIINLINQAKTTNKEIDDQIAKILQFIETDRELNRNLYIMLPHKVAAEVVAGWLRSHGIRNFDKPLIGRITAAAKTYRQGKVIDINKRYMIRITSNSLALQERDR